MIGIVDYGMGNLRSVQKALQRVGADAEIVSVGSEVDRFAKLIVPGVGAFKDAMTHLHQRRLIDPIRKFIASGRYTLGICLGLQLFFETSTEDGLHEGLGVVPGRVVRFEPTDPSLKVPHMGWNAIEPAPDNADNPLLAGIQSPAYVYFVHSYYAKPAEAADLATSTEYAGRFCSSVRRGNLFATQFHPEKSQQVGLKMLANFAGLR